MAERPQPQVFQSKQEAIAFCVKQREVDESYTRLARELFYQTIRDAHAYATNYTNRFKCRAGKNYSFNPEAAKKRVKDSTITWVNSPLFSEIAKHLQYDPQVAKQTVLDLLEAKNVDRIEPLINELKHEGRIYANRGPKPKEKAEQEASE